MVNKIMTPEELILAGEPGCGCEVEKMNDVEKFDHLLQHLKTLGREIGPLANSDADFQAILVVCMHLQGTMKKCAHLFSEDAYSRMNGLVSETLELLKDQGFREMIEELQDDLRPILRLFKLINQLGPVLVLMRMGMQTSPAEVPPESPIPTSN